MDKPEVIDSDSIDLRVYLKILQKWKLLIAGITLLAVITSGVLSFFVLSPVYQSKVVVMVKQYRDPKSTDTGQNTEQENLQSVVDSLSKLPEMTIKSYVAQVTNEALLRNIINILKLDQAVYTPESLAGLIDVQGVPDTNLIEISVKNNDPVLAAEIANKLAEKFLEFVSSANEKQLASSADYIANQLAEKNKELTKAINDLNSFRNQARSTALVQQELQIRNNDLAANKTSLLSISSQIQQLQAGLDVAQQKIKETPEKIKIVKIDITTGGKPMDTEELNPAYTELTNSINQKSVQIAELNVQRQNSTIAVVELQKEVDALRVELNAKQQTESQLQENVDQTKHTRDVLSDKLIQVQLAKAVNLSQTSLQIATPAFVKDKPVSPKKALNLAVAFILGLMVSVVLALVLEMTNNTINKAEDIEQHLGIPILGTIPFAGKEDLKIKEVNPF